mmetsp:Transcript_3106/g.5466  ORF Transcript_3106/g.5466 Transcript_3106/m.5466 type:complete len:87 (-) Transcript_3106:167-427(-)
MIMVDRFLDQSVLDFINGSLYSVLCCAFLCLIVSFINPDVEQIQFHVFIGSYPHDIPYFFTCLFEFQLLGPLLLFYLAFLSTLGFS